MLPFSLCNKKILAGQHMNRPPLSNDTIDSVLRHREVGRAKDLSAPLYYMAVNGERNIVRRVSRGKANWIGHILRRNCFLKQVIERKVEGRIEVPGRRGRRCKQLLDERSEKRGYCKLKEEALDRNV
jgi:hypothetical protein